MTSEYERIRLKNIADNKRILGELGFLNPFKPLPKVTKKSFTVKRKRASSPVHHNKRPKTENLENYGSVYGTRRKSTRLQGKPAAEVGDLPSDADVSRYDEEEEDDYKPVKRALPNRPMVYGAIPDVPVGTMWATRLECNTDGIHRPTVAGIHGGPEGAYSLALSGGYEDDIDLGTCFTYTGEGGRDLKGTSAKPKNLRTAPQSKDQGLSRGNLALTKNVETGNPVRVIRGYKSRSVFAPDEGYRYDGLYRVEKHWYTTGMAGYGVYKFALKRLEDQAPPPWDIQDEDSKEEKENQDSGFCSDTTSENNDDKISQSEGNNNEDIKEKIDQDSETCSDTISEDNDEKVCLKEENNNEDMEDKNTEDCELEITSENTEEKICPKEDNNNEDMEDKNTEEDE